MTTRLVLLVMLLSGCDVAVSFGDHDAGAMDARAPEVDGHVEPDAFVVDAGADAGLDAGHDPIDAGHDAAPDAAPVDAGSDAWARCAAPDASACVQCQAAMCCDLYLACQAAATCPCIVDCVLVGHTLSECAVHCGADHGEADPLVTCARGHCACP